MRAISNLLGHGSRTASYMLGSIVLVTASAVALLSKDMTSVAGWALDVLGVGFLVLLGVLIFVTAFSLVRMLDARNRPMVRDFWLDVGIQSANGVTTLALTYTLLGISLGIGGLSAQQLNPETVQGVIRELTGNFSLAFMTTVIGLPMSAGLRALLTISHGRMHLQMNTKTEERIRL